MARDISELGADVFDDTPKPVRKISPKKRNYIIGLSISALLLAGASVAAVILCNTALTDYSNVQNVTYYYTPQSMLGEGEKPTAVLYRLRSDVKYPSTFRVPSQIKGYKVVGIASNAFSGHSEIKHVVLPNTVTWVGEKTFYNCTNLSKFTWSKNLSEVGVDAFLNTAFYNNLLKQTDSIFDLPSGLLIYVGKNYLKPFTALISDSLQEAEINAIKSKYGVSEIKKFSEMNIKNIASGAFKENDKIVYIDLPETLHDISNSTFENCYNLKGLNALHGKVSTIRQRAFANCAQLVDIDLPDNLTLIGDEAFSGAGLVNEIPNISSAQELGSGIFSYCEDLESVNYTGTYVPDYTFLGCKSLNSITWGDGSAETKDKIDFIGIGAFSGTAFSSFTVPKNILTILDETFMNCENLETVSLYGNPTNKVVTIEPSEDEDEDEEEEVEEDTSSFIDNDGNEQPGTLLGVGSIRANAFNGCTKLSTINLYDDTYTVYEGNNGEFTFPNSLQRTDASSTISGNDNNVFKGAVTTKVILTPNLRSIGSHAFQDVKDLTEVTITHPEKSRLSTINTSAFENCEALEQFELPSSISVLGSSAFKNCTSLKHVGLGDTQIKSINAELFYNCPALEEIEIPNTVTNIKKDAFKNIGKVSHVVIPSSINEIQENAFTNCLNASDEKLPLYFSFTISQAKTLNLAKKTIAGEQVEIWKDDTVEVYYLLGDGEEKQTGYKYWDGNAADPHEI